ncbi:GNAT family N-acetyltransferase [Priestia megaterium]|uniref:GNAT family N-acetyltransferase n=1 Tax=Priestia megaterium TaxID=1404 RepID=UPI001C232833|nr:GNAT family N-acetyltransferase [Priestia megaterium]MBU8686493.1 GNAT family N-acetyltransferase [Priestia megaterium]
MKGSKWMSFKIVETKEEMDIFKEIWLEVCDEKTFESEEFHSHKTGVHFLFPNKNGEYVGTAEVGRYIPNDNSTVHYYYDFSKLNYIQGNREHVYEIDKVCIKPEYRSQGLLENMIYALLFHHKLFQSTYYVSAIESIFYRALTRIYKVPLVQVEEEEKKMQQFNNFFLHPVHLNPAVYINFLQNEGNTQINLNCLEEIVNAYRADNTSGE